MRKHDLRLTKCGLFIIVALLVAGLRFVWLSKQQAAEWVIHASYWFMWGLLGWGVVLGWRWWHARSSSLKVREWRAWLPLIPVLVAGLVLQLHEPHRLKVNYDEHVLAGMARTMHFEHMAAWPGGAHLFNGTVIPTSLMADKRPVFFPFLLSLLHNVAGYRLANVYVLNGVFGLTFLTALFFLGRRYAGVWGGWLFVVLLTGLPLLAQNATGGGFDLLNVTLVALLALATRAYIEEPGPHRLQLMTLLALCLANTRYESLLYVLVPAAAFLLVAVTRKSWPELPWSVALAPIGVLPALLSNAVFNSSDTFLQSEGEKFWDWSYFSRNFAHAVFYLFDPSRGGSNSVLLATAGLLSCVCFLFVLRREGTRANALTAETKALLLVGGVIAANVFVALGLRWGAWDDPLVSRFTLPLWLLFGWTTLELVRHLASEHGWSVARQGVAIGVLAVFLFAVPDASMARQTNKLKAATSLEWSLDFIKQYDPKRTTLVLANSAIPYINEGYASLLLDKSLVRFQNYASILHHGLYTEVLIVLEERRNRDNGQWVCDGKLEDLITRVRVERLGRIVIDPFYRTTIYRVLAVDDPSQALPWPTPDPDGERYRKQIYELLP